MTKTTGERIVEEWRSSHGYTDPLVGLPDLSRRIDEALITTMATAEGEVELLKKQIAEGKRFEIGESVQVFDHEKKRWVYGVIGASDSQGLAEPQMFWDNPKDVRFLPQTVELTEQEKVDALLSCPNVTHVQLLIESFNGKTLDQLCDEYGVATSREI